MNGGTQAVEFAAYLAGRWRIIVIACVSAVILAGVASLILPRRYTATATLMIEPPAGMDPRTATSLSPVYLESLKTFEHLASSDSLFSQALDELGMRSRYAGRPVESLKRSVLKVDKPVNTRIIEICATLEDPRQAQKLARYIAEHTVALSDSMTQRSAADSAQEARANLERAEKRLQSAVAARDKPPSVAGVQDELSGLAQLKYSVDRDLSDARAALASLPNGADGSPLRSKIADLEKQDRQFDAQLKSLGGNLERSTARRNELENESRSARVNYDAARTELDDINAAAAFRGERLQVLDPGILPERPSSPNTPLNTIVAFVISLIASVSYVTIRFAWERASFLHSDRKFASPYR
jgi:capsular polysaccharide biosynthesis protein